MADAFTDDTQQDTTPQNITNVADSEGRGASILSAYFGLDNSMPPRMNAVCPGSGGRDGMPLVFSHELDVSSVQAGDFVITNSDGIEIIPLCATFQPAISNGELRTVLLLGQFGSGALDSVCVVGDIWDKCREVTFRDSCIQPKPMSSVPELAFAEMITDPTTAACPEQLSPAIRVTWDAGVTLDGGAPVTTDYANRYSVTLSNGSVEIPTSLADIDDRDNNQVLCFNASTVAGWDDNPPVSVAFEAGFFTDPNEDGTNLATETTITIPHVCPDIKKNSMTSGNQTIGPPNLTDVPTVTPSIAAASSGTPILESSVLISFFWLVLPHIFKKLL